MQKYRIRDLKEVRGIVVRLNCPRKFPPRASIGSGLAAPSVAATWSGILAVTFRQNEASLRSIDYAPERVGKGQARQAARGATRSRP
jgi:hypothetical protein